MAFVRTPQVTTNRHVFLQVQLHRKAMIQLAWLCIVVSSPSRQPAGYAISLTCFHQLATLNGSKMATELWGKAYPMSMRLRDTLILLALHTLGRTRTHHSDPTKERPWT